MKKTISTLSWLWLIINAPVIPYAGSLLGLLFSDMQGISKDAYLATVLFITLTLSICAFLTYRKDGLNYPLKIMLSGQLYLFINILLYFFAVPPYIPNTPDAPSSLFLFLHSIVSIIMTGLIYLLPIYLLWSIVKAIQNRKSSTPPSNI